MLLEPIKTRHHLVISRGTKLFSYYPILNRLTKKAFMKRKINLSIKIKNNLLLFEKYWTIIKISRQQHYSILNVKLLDVAQLSEIQVDSPWLLSITKHSLPL